MVSDGQLDTFERSCRHWSEDGRIGMDAFYQLASVDYQLLAEQLHWGRIFEVLEQNFGPQVRLLDVACGSGQFPAALLKHGRLGGSPDLGRPQPAVAYSLLDPSRFSIETARSRLAAPFVASNEFECTIQQFDASASKYAIAWATHALYCVPPSELGVAMDQMLATLDEAGIGFIAHANKESHYVKFHDMYLDSLREQETLPYSTGEQVLDALRERVKHEDLAHWTIRYEGTLALDQRDVAERYLQRCLFDESISLDAMLAETLTGDYLRECIDEENGLWRFPQTVELIFFGRDAKQFAQLRS